MNTRTPSAWLSSTTLPPWVGDRLSGILQVQRVRRAWVQGRCSHAVAVQHAGDIDDTRAQRSTGQRRICVRIISGIDAVTNAIPLTNTTSS